MEYVYASLLLHYAGKPITEENVKKILEAAGIEADEARIKALVAALREVNIEEAIKTAAVPAVAAPVAPAEAPPAEEKNCLLYTSPSPRDRQKSRMPSSA